MKKAMFILVIIPLIIMAGCRGNKQSMETPITVDVTASYPEKELILQDFMDVEYIQLETTDEFITQGVVNAVGKNIILVTNRINDGTIFIFDRFTGKGIRTINRFGQSGEEYSQVSGIILDENKGEIIVNDYPARRFSVYDLYGNFKRSFKFADTSYYSYIFIYDQDHLICYKEYLPIDTEQSGHILISKQDGNIIREINVPVKEIKTPTVMKEGITVTPGFHRIVPYRGYWVLADASSDTLYTYHLLDGVKPFIARTPSIHSMDPEVFLYPTVLTDRYYFMYALKKELDFTTFKFPGTNLMYDKQENTLFKYTMYNDDFSTKKQVYWSNPVNQEIASGQSLDAFELVDAYNEGKLKDRLKDIASRLDEESNPVIMLVKYINESR
jgi:hypothetical protein